MAKTCNRLITLLLTVLIIWSCISYIEVAIKNAMPNPEYSNYNIISDLFMED